MSESKNPRSKLALQLLRRGAEALGIEDAKEKRKHLLMGFASQLFGIDPDSGEPTLDFRPRGVDVKFGDDGSMQTKYRGAIPGIVDSTLSMANLPAILASAATGDEYVGPKFAQQAQDRADVLDEALRKELKLGDPETTLDTFSEGLGMMAGQVPIPRGRAARGALSQIKPGIEMLREVSHSPVEYLTPTIRPSLQNYVSGGAFPAALGELFPRLVELKEKFYPSENSDD